MGVRSAVTTGTVLSLAASAAWSWAADLTIGPMPPLSFGHSVPAGYAALAAAPAGNGPGLFAVTAAIYTACFLVSGLRARRKARR